MSKIKIHAGDFGAGSANMMFSMITFPWKPGDGFTAGEKILLSELAEVEQANDEAVKRIGGTVGWGVVGAAVLGPVGLLAGLLAGGRGTDVTFVAKFKDNRKFLGTTDSKTFTKLKAAVF